MKNGFITYIAIFSLLADSCICHASSGESNIRDLKGIERKELFKIYPRDVERTYRVQGDREWISFTLPGESRDIVTFYLEGNVVVSQTLNERHEIVEEYMSEFCSKYFLSDRSKIGSAIRSVLNRIPGEVFFSVTDRSRPVVFTECHYSGPGRLANSSDIRSLEGDPPTFTKGIWIIKLSTELETAEDKSEIESIVAHELAHYMLDNGRRIGEDPLRTDKYEMQSAYLVEQWGFKEEMVKAYKRFGDKKEENLTGKMENRKLRT